MAIIEEDKTEIESMITKAIEKLKTLVDPVDPVAEKKPEVVIPIPKAPKSNEELEDEIKKEKEGEKKGDFLSKLWLKIW